MASEAGTPSAHVPRRRTLDDIRQEIEAEFSAPAAESPDDPDVATPAVRDSERRRALEEYALAAASLADASTRPSHWRGYVMAGAIGCIAGQLMILAYVAVTRYGGDLVGSRPALITPRLSAPLLRTDEAAESASIGREAVSAPAAPAPAASEEDMISAAAGTPGALAAPDVRSSTTTASPPASAAMPVQADSVAPVAAPEPRAARAPVERTEAPEPPRVVRQAPPRAPSPSASSLRGPAVGPGDWVESQAQLREALAEWLALWERGGDANVSDAEVVLGADGLTAKTRVPTRSGSRIVIREQQWERGSNGWTIVREREAERPRP